MTPALRDLLVSNAETLRMAWMRLMDEWTKVREVKTKLMNELASIETEYAAIDRLLRLGDEELLTLQYLRNMTGDGRYLSVTGVPGGELVGELGQAGEEESHREGDEE